MASNADMPTLSDAIGSVEEFVGIVRLIKLFSLSSMVLYIYNYILTLESEVSIMWKANLRLGKILYFILRYCTLFSIVFLNIGLHIPGLSSELRVYALYQGDRRILYLIILLSCAMIASFATFLTIVLRADHEELTVFGPEASMYICQGSALPPVYDKIWVTKIVNEALMFSLALCKGIANMKEYKGMYAARRLMVFLVRDSVLYFLVVLAVCLMTQLVWVCAGQDYIELSVGLTLAVGSIMSQGLVVNVREQFVIEKERERSSTMRSGTHVEHPSVFEYTYGEEMSVTMVESHSEEV